jgi:hypothetical protein
VSNRTAFATNLTKRPAVSAPRISAPPIIPVHVVLIHPTCSDVMLNPSVACVQPRLDGEPGMMSPNPILYQIAKLLCLPQEIFGLGLAGGIGAVLIYLVSFPATNIEISHQRDNRVTHSDFQRFERRHVMCGSDYAVARAGDYHFRDLQDRVIGRRESPVRGSASKAAS